MRPVFGGIFIVRWSMTVVIALSTWADEIVLALLLALSPPRSTSQHFDPLVAFSSNPLPTPDSDSDSELQYGTGSIELS